MSKWCGLLLVVSTAWLATCHRALPELPVVTLLEPANNSAVPKSVRIRAQATPGDNLFEACLLVDRELVQKQGAGQDSVFTFIWDASAQAPGSRHSLAVEVIDNQLRRACSDSVGVTITQTTGSSIHGGTLRHDETWTAAGSPHVVAGNLRVEAVLTIEPGSVVKFRSGASLTVGDGALVADGSSSLITFTGMTQASGSWGSIEFASQARPGRSIMDNCLVEYGGSDARASTVVHSPVRIDNCVFRLNENASIAADPMAVSGIGSGNQFSGNGTDDIVVFGGEILSDARWPEPGAPYLIEDRIEVHAHDQVATLTIDPGTRLHFTHSGMIGVEEGGVLIADGSMGMITFTSEFPDDNWEGIAIEGWEPVSVSAVFRNCLIENADNDFWEECAISVEEAAVDIQNTTIRNSPGYGIVCTEGSYFAGFRDNLIVGCGLPAMLIEDDYVRTIGEGNSFTGNDVDNEYHDGIVVLEWEGIVTSATWPDLGVPYILQDELYLDNETGTPPILTIGSGARLESDDAEIEVNEATLVLEPGAVVAMSDANIELRGGVMRVGAGARLEFIDGGIHVSGGALLADGSGGRITFTSGDFPEVRNGDWEGITFETPRSGPQSALRDCIVEYGGKAGGNLVCNACEPLLVDNEINHSSTFGIRLHYSLLSPDSLLAQNRFQDNDSGNVAIRPPLTIPPPKRKVRSVAPYIPRGQELRAHPVPSRRHSAKQSALQRPGM